MLRTLLLISALGLLAVGLLTVVRAPTYNTWKLAILAGEFGHWVAGLALIVGGLALAQLAVGGGGVMARAVTWATLLLAVAAGVLLLRPRWEAWRIAKDLPERLAAGLGEAKVRGPVLARGRWWRLPARGGEVAGVAKVETRVFAHAGTADELALDFYRPRGGLSDLPCIVVVHGGGWDGGDRRQLMEWNELWAERGFAVAAVSYRLAPAHPWPAQREDLLAAIAWLKANAGELGISRDNFVLLGRSAGGQIATATAYTANDPAIRAVASFYSPYDLGFVWSIARPDDVLNSVKLLTQYLGGSPEQGREPLYESASPERLVRGPGVTPPTLLIHGALDELVWHKHSERLDARLAEAGVPHYFLSLPWATHACDFNPNGPSGQLIDYAVGWLLTVSTRPGYPNP
ncbi:MAG: alpha/beta hydrolase [Verrucomicrobiota bacterium]